MGFFRTKDPKTGEPRLGAGVYLIICALMVGAVVLWNVRQNAGDPAFLKGGVATSAGPKNPSNLKPVAEAAEQHKSETPLEETPGVATKAASARDFTFGTGPNPDPTANVKPVEQPDNLDTIQNTVELLRQNQDRAEREKQEAVAKAKAEEEAKIAEIRKKALVTATVEATPEPNTNVNVGRPGTPVRAAGQQQQNINSGALTIYDVKRDEKKQGSVSQPLIPTGFDTQNFLPRGHLFPVYLLTTIQTVNQEDIVVFGVAENVIFQHKVQIPFGTRLLGTAAGASFEDRVAVNIDTILYPDGRELPISGLVKDAGDLSAGIRGYYIPQPVRVQLAPYLNQFLATWTQAVADRYTRYYENQNQNSNSGGTTDAALNAASNLIIAQANKIQARLDRRYPEKVVIPIGTKAYVQLRSPLDLTRARVAGSLDSHQPILPGFENNPITPAGVVERTASQPGGQLGSTSMNPVPVPAPAAPVPAQAAAAPATSEAAQAQEALYYQNALNQLNSLQQQLNNSKESQRSGGSQNAPINWPAGDIQ